MLLWGRVVSTAVQEGWGTLASLQKMAVCLWTYKFGYNNTSVLFWYSED